MKYDIFGNVVEAELSCCVKRSFTFSNLTAFSRPDRVRAGGATGLSLETNYQYNFFTGLPDSETDPGGQPTTYQYDSALRPISATLPTGAVTETRFENDRLQLTSHTVTKGGATLLNLNYGYQMAGI